MLTQETLRELESLLGFKAMVNVISMQAILHSTKIKLDLKRPSAFQDKCLEKFSRLLGEGEKSAARTMKILLACEEFEQRKSLEGLGGCVVYPLEQLVEKTLAEDAPSGPSRPRP